MLWLVVDLKLLESDLYFCHVDKNVNDRVPLSRNIEDQVDIAFE